MEGLNIAGRRTLLHSNHRKFRRLLEIFHNCRVSKESIRGDAQVDPVQE
jgi:hypothetical protein